MRSGENVECGKYGVWKVWSVENEKSYHSSFAFNRHSPCGMWKTNVWLVEIDNIVNSFLKLLQISLLFRWTG